MATDDNAAEEIAVLSFVGPESRREEAIQALKKMGFLELGSMLGVSPAFVLAQELSRHANGRLTQGELEALLGIRS